MEGNYVIIDLDWIDEQIKEMKELQKRFERNQEALIGLSTQIGIFNQVKNNTISIEEFNRLKDLEKPTPNHMGGDYGDFYGI